MTANLGPDTTCPSRAMLCFYLRPASSGTQCPKCRRLETLCPVSTVGILHLPSASWGVGAGTAADPRHLGGAHGITWSRALAKRDHSNLLLRNRMSALQPLLETTECSKKTGRRIAIKQRCPTTFVTISACTKAQINKLRRPDRECT